MASNGATGWGLSSCNAGDRDKPNAGDRDKAMRSETSAGFVVSVSHFMRFLGQPQGDFRLPSALFSKTWPLKAQITGHGAGTFFAHLSLRSRSPSHPAHYGIFTCIWDRWYMWVLMLYALILRVKEAFNVNRLWTYPGCYGPHILEWTRQDIPQVSIFTGFPP